MKLNWNDYITTESQPIAIHKTQPELNDSEHEHEFDELVIVDQGCGTHILNGKPVYIQPGDIFFVSKHDHHAYQEMQNLALTNVLFSANQNFKYIPPVHEILQSNHNISENSTLWIERTQKAILTGLLEKVQSCITCDQGNGALQREGLILQALSLISHRAQAVQPLSTTNNIHQVDRLINFLRENCTKEINWDDICQRFGVSTRNLFRILKRETENTPDAYITKLRLANARRLLHDSDISVTDVAYNSGFTNLSHFCRVYRSEYGFTPSEYRTRNLSTYAANAKG